MNAPDPHALLDAAGLARRLQVGVDHVQELRRSGRIPHVRIGPKTIRFDFAEVLAALRSGTDTAKRRERAS